MIDLPKGISRHEVRFLRYPQAIYVVKELPTAAARRDYGVLRIVESFDGPAVRPVGLVEDRCPDPGAEESAALITLYEPFSFSYREMLQGPGFGSRRVQMLDAFAYLLVELHLNGVFWGDCSLSNVLYRFDAEAIETIMVDAETARHYPEGLTDGQRAEDIEIMVVNVAGGMADIAAAHGRDLDEADLHLGEDIADRYRTLWDELTREDVIATSERYRIEERIARLNQLGFTVDEVDLLPTGNGDRLRVKLKVAGRNFHSSRLKELTGVEALEQQARQILTDLYYFQATHDGDTPTGKAVAAVRWRVEAFEPYVARLAEMPDVADPIQAFCDVLHHRFVLSQRAGHDVGTAAAFEDWVASGKPGYPVETPPADPASTSR
ncbi:MAG: LPS kinase [Acidimicrobiia bacterium]|nr:MAG: LPS kinase [Acidimicrobiia bacterium]